MANDVPWPVFVNIGSGTYIPFVEGGEDVIDVTWEKNDGDQNEVVLETASNVTWMKRIRVLDGSGGELATVTTHDAQHGPAYAVLPQGWARLEFVKAKILGTPTGMYATPPAGQPAAIFPLPGNVNGWRLHFRWTKD